MGVATTVAVPSQGSPTEKAMPGFETAAAELNTTFQRWMHARVVRPERALAATCGRSPGVCVEL